MTKPYFPPAGVAQGEAHLWVLRAPPDDAGPAPLATHELGPAETRRASAFRRPRDRLTYTAAHIALRRLLSVYTGIRPERLRLDRAPCPHCAGGHGPPVLTGTAGPPHFSLSHSHGLVAVGVAGAPVGVDVQRLPTAESARACLPRLHPAERRELETLPQPQLPAAFGELWARKEAYLKGLGIGLCRGADTHYLGLGGPGAPDRPAGWSVRGLPVRDGYATAVALRADTPHRTVTRHLPEEWLYAEDATDLIAAARTGFTRHH